MKHLLSAAAALLLLGSAAEALSQSRVAVLPFRNTHGDMKFNERCYDLADSVQASLLNAEGSGTAFVVVPSDSVDLVLASLNLDPSNPQYESDVWRAVEQLKVDKVVTGNFDVRYEKILINAYVYSVSSKMADQTNKAVDLYKPYDQALSLVRIIVKRLLPGL